MAALLVKMEFYVVPSQPSYMSSAMSRNFFIGRAPVFLQYPCSWMFFTYPSTLLGTTRGITLDGDHNLSGMFASRTNCPNKVLSLGFSPPDSQQLGNPNRAHFFVSLLGLSMTISIQKNKILSMQRLTITSPKMV